MCETKLDLFNKLNRNLAVAAIKSISILIITILAIIIISIIDIGSVVCEYVCVCAVKLNYFPITYLASASFFIILYMCMYMHVYIVYLLKYSIRIFWYSNNFTNLQHISINWSYTPLCLLIACNCNNNNNHNNISVYISECLYITSGINTCLYWDLISEHIQSNQLWLKQCAQRVHTECMFLYIHTYVM